MGIVASLLIDHNSSPSIEIAVRVDPTGVLALAQMLSQLSTSPSSKIVLALHPDGCDSNDVASTLQLCVCMHSSRHRDHFTQQDSVLTWSQSTEAWLEASELVAPLIPGTWQFLSDAVTDSVLVRVECIDPHAEPR